MPAITSAVRSVKAVEFKVKAKNNRALDRTNPHAAELARHRTALGELAKARKWLPKLLRQYKDHLSLTEADDLEEACIALERRIKTALQAARLNYNRWNHAKQQSQKFEAQNQTSETTPPRGAAGV